MTKSYFPPLWNVQLLKTSSNCHYVIKECGFKPHQPVQDANTLHTHCMEGVMEWSFSKDYSSATGTITKFVENKVQTLTHNLTVPVQQQ